MMKKGISLIVLVITIIVMIILAASVVITLSNTGVINRASQAVDLTNESAVQDLAALVWADAYMDNKRGTDLVNEVTTKLGEQGVTTDKWNITVTDTGVSVINKSNIPTTLGSLITSAADYGKTVNYESDNGVKDWKVFYHTSEYVYLIASEKQPKDKLPTLSGATITETKTLVNGVEKKVANIYWSRAPRGIEIPSSAETKWMAEYGSYSSPENRSCISYFLDETLWKGFENTQEYIAPNGESYVKRCNRNSDFRNVCSKLEC